MSLLGILTVVNIVVLVLPLLLKGLSKLKLIKFWNWVNGEKKELNSISQGDNEYFVLVLKGNTDFDEALLNSHFQRITVKKQDS